MSTDDNEFWQVQLQVGEEAQRKPEKQPSQNTSKKFKTKQIASI